MGLLEHRDGLTEGFAVARKVAVDGAGPVGLAVAASRLAQRRLHHRHIVTPVLGALADRTIQFGHETSPCCRMNRDTAGEYSVPFLFVTEFLVGTARFPRRGALAGGALYRHGTFIYLMGPDGKFLSLFPPVMRPAALAAAIARYLP